LEEGTIVVWRVAIPLATAMLLGAPGAAQERPSGAEPKEPTVEVRALCAAWLLTENALVLAEELKLLALERVEQATKRSTECEAKPDCAESWDREKYKQDLGDARSQHAKAAELAAVMLERKKIIGGQLQSAQGQSATYKCKKA
jgi:hypothetical protein